MSLAKQATTPVRARSPGTPDPIDVFVGARVRAERMRLGVTQTWLAKKIGVTFQQVQKYERGTNRFSASMLVRAARAFEIPVAELLPDALGEAALERVELEAVKGGPQLAQLFLGLSDRKRKLVLNMVAALADDGVAEN